jgi:hypothetical protein
MSSRNVKSIRVYMENGFEDWNLRGKFQFQDGEWFKYHSSTVFYSALSALIHLNTCMRLMILQKVILRKRKVAMLSYPVAFSSRNEFRFVFTWDRSQISIWIEISIRNEIRIELDTDWIVTHSGLIQTFNMVCIKMEWVHSGLKVNPDSCKQHLTANIQGI